jgi:uncharacterized protein (TIGR04222 family)
VQLAIERPAEWLVQHGGGWPGAAIDAASTYGLHLLYLATLLGGVLLLRRLHRMAVDTPEPDSRPYVNGSPTPRSTSPHGLLFPYEAAYLAGGPQRVAETALSTLLEDGWIESSPSGRLRLGARGDLVASLDPVAISVLSVVAGGPPTAAAEARRRASRLREVLDVSGILIVRRLLVAAATKRRLQRLRWAASGVLGLAGGALVVAAASRAADLVSPPVIAAALLLVVGLSAPALIWRRQFFRTALGEVELLARYGCVCDKAHWVASRVWSDQPDIPIRPWADVDRIVDALQRPPAARPVQLGWLWAREDTLMAIALIGARGIPNAGLRRGLSGGGRAVARAGSSTALSTPVHNIVRPRDV